jgi:hypothetical protein
LQAGSRVCNDRCPSVEDEEKDGRVIQEAGSRGAVEQLGEAPRDERHDGHEPQEETSPGGGVSDADGRDRAGDEQQWSRRYTCVVCPMHVRVDAIGDDEQQTSRDRERAQAGAARP